jgi:hypothetical protein
MAAEITPGNEAASAFRNGFPESFWKLTGNNYGRYACRNVQPQSFANSLAGNVPETFQRKFAGKSGWKFWRVFFGKFIPLKN